ncbi:Putative transcriptional accessory protein [Mesorhizobium loti]|uniref:hypothetical protein n=1 Tax=Mesorhizobium sp. 131-2-5 TaxID=2744519 RepID=UPI000819934E|nr:hypothetical protein [Mesorhizobium sp. 131-2-5]BAV45831.1 Putative transcriptional accessory protein [Mesorhizobium loti]BCH01825.1 hypothetical protein MesoLj131b_38240 [Mesorhizobium sp. 131-2-5]
MDESPDPTPFPPPIITQEAQERWASLPGDRHLQIALKREDLDHLFLSIRECIIGQGDLANTVQALSHGNTEAAQKFFDAAQLHQRNAIEQIDRLVLHAMTTATPV